MRFVTITITTKLSIISCWNNHTMNPVHIQYHPDPWVIMDPNRLWCDHSSNNWKFEQELRLRVNVICLDLLWLEVESQANTYVYSNQNAIVLYCIVVLIDHYTCGFIGIHLKHES